MQGNLASVQLGLAACSRAPGGLVPAHCPRCAPAGLWPRGSGAWQDDGTGPVPIAVMGRATLGQGLGTDRLDLWYERTAEKQYTRELSLLNQPCAALPKRQLSASWEERSAMPCCSCALTGMTLPSCPAVTSLVEHWQRAFSASRLSGSC
jgi:hypothetical protein